MPVREITCRVPAASSVMVTSPVLVPVSEGVKVMSMVQVAPPAATDEPQPLVWPKSPFATMLVMESGALPLLIKVTVCAGL